MPIADQREHVGAAVHERRPAALEEGPARPEDDGRGESEFDPRRCQAAGNSALNAATPAKHAAHRDGEQRRSEGDADPEAAGHVAEFGIFFLRAVTVRGSRAMPQIGQRPGADADDLGMHGAGVFGARGGERELLARGPCRKWGTAPGFDLADLGAHGADVGWHRVSRTALADVKAEKDGAAWNCVSEA